MNDTKLLQQYIKTLELENAAKNKETQTLYKRIETLAQQNQEMYLEIQHIKNKQSNIPSDELLRQIELQKQKISNRVQQYGEQVQKLMRNLQQKSIYVQNIQQQRKKDAERITDLEKILKQVRKNQMKLKSELSKLQSRNRVISSQLQQYEDFQSGQNKISELIGNYEKIQQIAKQKQAQNQYVKEENLLLIEENEELKRIIKMKDDEMKSLERNRRQKDYAIGNQLSGMKGIQNFEEKEILSRLDLVRQHNKLIQRITELERQKNMIYIQTLENSYKRRRKSKNKLISNSSANPLRIFSSTSNANFTSPGNKIRLRIQTLRQRNEDQMESLRI